MAINGKYVPTLSSEPGIAVGADWSAVGAAVAAEEERSLKLQLSAGPEPGRTAACLEWTVMSEKTTKTSILLVSF